MPNVEYFAPWFRSEALQRTMPYERWLTLSSHAQRISRFVVGQPGEPVIGAGKHHPRRAVREQMFESELADLGDSAEGYLRRL